MESFQQPWYVYLVIYQQIGIFVFWLYYLFDRKSHMAINKSESATHMVILTTLYSIVWLPDVITDVIRLFNGQVFK